MDKFIRVKFQTPNGERSLVYQHIDNVGPNELLCKSRCAYGKICKHIPDPRTLDNKTSSFIEFCTEVAAEVPEDKRDIWENAIPVPGTIEENLGDLFDPSVELLKSNPIVRLKEVIDKVCKGWCDDFSCDYKNCTTANKTCILNSLFVNNNIEKIKSDEPENENKKTEEEKK